MGDWNTLHFFDSRKFYDHTFDQLKNGLLGKTYWNNITKSVIVDHSDHQLINTIAVVNTLRPDFSLFNDSKEVKHLEDGIENFNRLLPIVLFKECAYFSPHFKLGKSLLSHYTQFNDSNSIIAEALGKLAFPGPNSILARYGAGIKNWLTAEEVEIALLDFDNLPPSEDLNSNSFLKSLKRFFGICAENGLGILSGVNLSEYYLSPVLKFSVDYPEFISYPLLVSSSASPRPS